VLGNGFKRVIIVHHRNVHFAELPWRPRNKSCYSDPKCPWTLYNQLLTNLNTF